MTANNNLKSPGYSKVIQWLSIIWHEFDEIKIAESFSKCGIISQTDLHSALSQLLELQKPDNFSEYVTEIEPYDEIDGFDPDAIQDIFDKDDEVLADLEVKRINNDDDDEEDETFIYESIEEETESEITIENEVVNSFNSESNDEQIEPNEFPEIKLMTMKMKQKFIPKTENAYRN